MTMQFDTGSALLYVVTEKCQGCPESMDRFDTSKSTTYRTDGEKASEVYGAGQVTGDISQDQVCFS